MRSKHPLIPVPQRSRILALARRYGAVRVRLFGSVARGDAGPASDIDLLVRMRADRSFFDFVSLWQDLEAALGRRVDLVSEGGLSPYLRGRILKEARPL